ncbi:Zinc finger RING-HC [Orpheovirus IHUMI-LCC2]|uniref:Zinc finger RING-HC n=1 Tax=Orpheovirus IHUMI-LCC2 TaxID=2023057 RepID=A0A2I2L5T6_9VIRU|nr:Zinc finger RING-HC [Orpheovirus IHUMI-LCC2]SNW62860.1 Zinc finger RING-HC [Orpheovirus IHUMI-LCC2]
MEDMMKLSTCPVCYDVMSRMMVAKCGHSICKGCFKGLKKKCCPICQESINECDESNFDLYKSLYLLYNIFCFHNQQYIFNDMEMISRLSKANVHDESTSIYIDISKLYGIDVPNIEDILKYGKDEKKNTKISCILTTVELTTGETINLIQYAWKIDKFKRLENINNSKKNIRKYDIYNIALMLASKTFIDYLRVYAIKILGLRVESDDYDIAKVEKCYNTLVTKFQNIGYGTLDTDLKRSIDAYIYRATTKGWKIHLSSLYTQLCPYYNSQEINFYLKYSADFDTKKLFGLN